MMMVMGGSKYGHVSDDRNKQVARPHFHGRFMLPVYKQAAFGHGQTLIIKVLSQDRLQFYTANAVVMLGGCCLMIIYDHPLAPHS